MGPSASRANSLHGAGLIVAVAGVVLLIAMFLPWFGPSSAQEQAIQDAQRVTEQFGGEAIPLPDLTASAWQSFGFVDLVLLATAVLAILTGVVLIAAPPGRSTVAPIAALTGLGALASLLVLYRVINPPGELGREYGLFIGFFAALAVAAGGWLALERRTSSATRQSVDSIGSRRHG